MNAPVSLKQLAEGKAEGVQKATYFKVDPDVVEFEPGFNLREEGPDLDVHLEAMYVAMKAGAYFPPIDVSVVDGRIIARDGHCRTRTAKRIKAEGVSIMLEARQFRGNEAECVFHMISSAQGKPLTPLESGRGFFRLIRYGLDVQAICSRTGVSRTTVENGLILAEAPLAIQQMIVKGEVAAHVAVDMIRKHGSKAVDVLREVLDKAKADGTARVTKRHVAGPRVPPRIVKSFVAAAASLHQHVRHDLRENLLKASDDEIAGMGDIPVPAATLKALLAAHSEIEPDGATA